MDVTKLGLPWYECGCKVCCGSEDADEFIVLASQAFDVMMRRGWHPRHGGGGEWCVYSEDGIDVLTTNEQIFCWPDPFTALVEADRFMADREKTAELA